jgi:excisionase family DNA binding protein
MKLKRDKKPEILTIEELASFLRWAPGTIRNKVSRGEIPYIKIGRSVRFKRVDIYRWINGKYPSGKSKGKIPALKPVSKKEATRALLSIVGCGDSGLRDLSIKHDYYLYDQD